MTVRALGVLLLLGACHATPAASAPAGAATIKQEILGSNALASNALVSNALVSNALASNALASNALASNALASNALVSNALASNSLRPDGLTEGAVARQFLSYVYSCAMPPDASLPLVIGGVDYGALKGAVGLAPGWGKDGGSCDRACQRWVTACLLARTNFWGVPVKLSLRGDHPALAAADDEKSRYPLREGTYFGNLFAPDGTRDLYACAGPGSNLPQLTNRFCSGAQGPCNIRVLFDCVNPLPAPLLRPDLSGAELPTRFACQRMDPNDGGALDCWTHGVSIYGDDPVGASYPQAITVNLQAPVAICGDGVCTGGETAFTCGSDCSTGWARGFPGLANITLALGPLGGGNRYALVAAYEDTDLGAGTVKILNGELAIILSNYDASGSPLWSRQIGHAASTHVLGGHGSLIWSSVDAAGNLYLSAQLSGDVWLGDQDVVPGGNDGKDAMVARLSPKGERLWVRQVRGEVLAWVARPDGTPLLFLHEGEDTDQRTLYRFAGFGADGTPERPVDLTVDLGSGPAYQPMAVAPDGTVIMATIPPGVPVGLARLHLDTGASDAFDPVAGTVTAVTVAPDGDVYAAALEGANIPHLLRFTSAGALLLDKPLAAPIPGEAPPDATATYVGVNAAGDIAVAGAFFKPMNLDNEALTPIGGSDGDGDGNTGTATPMVLSGSIFVASYTGAGALRWAKRLGGGGFNVLTSAHLLDDGTVLVGGGYTRSGVFDGWILQNQLDGRRALPGSTGGGEKGGAVFGGILPTDSGILNTVDGFLLSIPAHR